MDGSGLEQQCVLHFGDLGSRSDINRTFGPICTQSYPSDAPPRAVGIVRALGYLRSNACLGMNGRRSWRLMGECFRRIDGFESLITPEDIRPLARALVAEQRRRQIDPTSTKLRGFAMKQPASSEETYAVGGMREMSQRTELETLRFNSAKQLPHVTTRSAGK